jgi:hypothetical protein
MLFSPVLRATQTLIFNLKNENLSKVQAHVCNSSGGAAISNKARTQE